MGDISATHVARLMQSYAGAPKHLQGWSSASSEGRLDCNPGTAFRLKVWGTEQCWCSTELELRSGASGVGRPSV